ncbi:hypothetical protein WJX72_002453 [[Myrmecia] bisecta]|uniref:Phytanoyl-CoA dioxygenase n=1 Tax=[Myrmecia] bisecta TaxID=41462 RepID=A0AAW1QBA3_9CHLO
MNRSGPHFGACLNTVPASLPATAVWEDAALAFQESGFVIVPDFLSSSELDALRQECDTLVELAQDQAGAAAACSREWAAEHRGCIFETTPRSSGSSACTSRHAFANARSRWPLTAVARDLLLGSRMQGLVYCLLGCPGYLFNDQYIVKPAMSQLSAFHWHRDSDWCNGEDIEHHPYISVWIALDDMHPGNGSLHIKPLQQTQHAAPPGAVENGGSANTADCAKQAVAVTVAAGTLVVMCDRVVHCSGPNNSLHTRRAWMPQFSAGPICQRSDGSLVSLAVPLNCDQL